MIPETETTAVVNPSPAASTTDTSDRGEVERHSAFLGRPVDAEIVADQPEPAQAIEGAQEDGATADGAAAAAADPEDDPNWLPDEQLKVFPDDVIAKYAKRYGYTAEEVAADPRIATALHDKINSDIYIAQQREERENPDGQTTDDETDPNPAATQPQPIDPVEARKQYYAQVDKFVDTLDPQAMNEAGNDLLAAMGVDITSTDPEVQALVKNAPKIGRTMAKFGADLFNTMLPQLLPNLLPTMVENTYPSFGSMYEKAMYAHQWDTVRADPQYAALPNYGTKEFQQATRAAAAKYPGFEQMVFTDQKGRALPPAQQATMKYQILAKEMAGVKVNPAVVARAVETGRTLNAQTDQRRRQGAALNSGKTTGGFAKGSDGDVNNSMISAYNARNGSAFGWKK